MVLPVVRFCLVALGVLAGSAAHAACASPAGTVGDIRYATNLNIMAYCNGTDWVSMAGWTGSGGGASSLAGLSDVDTGGVSTGKSLVYNGSHWVPGDTTPFALGALTNVNTSGASTGSILAYNGSSWVISNTGVISTLAGLSDVNTSGAATGSILAYNGSSWVVSSSVGATSAASSTGAIQFNAGGGAFGGDTNHLYWDNASKRLGVGTNNPSRTLHLVGPDGPVAALPTRVGPKDALVIENNANVNIGLVAGPGASAAYKIYVDGQNEIKGGFVYHGNNDFVTLSASDTLTIGLTVTKIGSVSVTDALQVGSSSLACNPSIGGAIRYATPSIQVCNGGSWQAISGGGGSSAVSNTGAIQFNAGGGAFGGDTDNLYWDNANKRLGIGTATPGATLEVSSTTGARFRYGNRALDIIGTADGGFHRLVGVGTNAGYSFENQNAPLAVITPGGRLGIGTTTPSLTLHVSTSLSGLGMFETSSANGWIQLIPNNNYGQRVEMAVRNGGDFGGLWAGWDILTWHRTGRVGIAMSTGAAPSATLHVKGTISATDAIQVGSSSLTCTSGITGAIRYSGGNLQYCNGTAWTSLASAAAAANPDRIVSGTTNIIAHQNASLTFTTAGSPKMVIGNGNGYVGIGTTTPGSQLSVSGSGVLRLGGFLPRLLLEPSGFDEANRMWSIDNSLNGTLRFYTNDISATGLGDNPFVHMILTSNSALALGHPYGVMPKAALDVAGTISASGAIQVGTSGLTCTSGIPGAIRYSGGHLQYCNGSAWTTLTSGGGTGAANHVAYWTGTNTLAHDANQFTWDAANNFLGIGTGNPSRSLHIQGNSTVRIDRDVATAGIQIHQFPAGNFSTPLKGFILGVSASGVNNGIFAISDYQQAVNGSALNRFTINTGGYVGIGTESPGSQFSVSGTGQIRLGGSYPRITFEGANNDTANKMWSIDNFTNGLLRFYTSDYSPTDYGINGSVRMVLTSNSELGVGKSVPLGVIHGSASNSGGTVTGLVLENNSTYAANSAVRIHLAGVPTVSRGTYLEAINHGGLGGHSLVFGTGADSTAPVERMRIDRNGRVGIGVVTPSSVLQLSGGLGIGNLNQAQAVSETLGGTNSIQLLTDTHFGGTYDDHSGYVMYSTMPGAWGSAKMHFARSTDWGSYNLDNPALTVGLTTGLETMNPTARFHIAGNNRGHGGIYVATNTSRTISFGNVGVEAPGAGSAGMKLQLYGSVPGTMSSGDYAIGVEGSNMWFNSNFGYKWYLQAMSVPSLRMDSAGRVGFGTGNDGLLSPVTISTTDTELLRMSTPASQWNSMAFYQGNARKGVVGASSTGELAFYSDNNAAIYAGASPRIYAVSATGNVGIGTTNPNQGRLEVKGGTVCVDTNNDDNATSCIANESDARLKQNVRPLENSLEKIVRLQGVSFDWKVSDSEVLKHYPLISRFKNNPHSIGLIAQDVQKVVPEAIEGETIGDDEVQYLQLDYTKLVPHLVNGMKELKAENDLLRQRLDALEGRFGEPAVVKLEHVEVGK